MIAALTVMGSQLAQAQIMPWENRTENDEDQATGTSIGTKGGRMLLEDVVNGTLIHAKGSGAIEWMKDGERYSRLESNPDGGRDLVA